jgi:hypothetical protein
MTIKEFAANYRVRTRRDSCDEEIIPGKPRKLVPEDRCHIYDHADGKHFGVSLTFRTPRRWTAAKQRLSAAGFRLQQNGDTEGTLLFNPCNTDHAQAAIREAGVRTQKLLSETVKAALAARLKRVRPAEERGLEGKITRAVPEMTLTTINVAARRIRARLVITPPLDVHSPVIDSCESGIPRWPQTSNEQN